MIRPTVYIAGPMTNGTGGSFNMEKIHEAIEVFFRLIELGYAPHCPHLTVFCEFMQPHRIKYEQWISLDMTYVEQSDAVFRVPGDSKGADREVVFATAQGVPVVGSFEALAALNLLAETQIGLARGQLYYHPCPTCPTEEATVESTN